MGDKNTLQDIPKETPKDISKRTIAILLVIAIILSVTSTLVAVARTPQVKFIGDSASAEISVNVVEPPEPVEAQVKVNVVEGE